MLVDDQGDSATAVQLRDRAAALASRLAGCVGPGECVSWILPSTVDAAVLLAALARLGAVQNPVVPIYGEQEVRFVTAQAGTALLVTPGRFRSVDYGAVRGRSATR